jgi:hypothetical protein
MVWRFAMVAQMTLYDKRGATGKALDRLAIALAVVGMLMAAYAVYGFLAH